MYRRFSSSSDIITSYPLCFSLSVYCTGTKSDVDAHFKRPSFQETARHQPKRTKRPKTFPFCCCLYGILGNRNFRVTNFFCVLLGDMAQDAAQDREIKTSLMSSGSLSPRVEAVHTVVEKVGWMRIEWHLIREILTKFSFYQTVSDGWFLSLRENIH